MAEKKIEDFKITLPQLRYLRQLEKRKLAELTRRKEIAVRLMGENTMVKDSLAELSKGNKDTIIPLGAGIYIKGGITPSSFQRTLPGNVVLPSTKEEVEKELVARDKIYVNDLTQLDKEILSTKQNLDEMNALFRMSTQHIRKK